MNLTPFVIAWICLGIATATLAIYRKLLSMREDDYLHIEDWNEAVVAQQTALAHKFDIIDRWGKALTVVVVVAGAVLGGIYLYMGWMRS